MKTIKKSGDATARHPACICNCHQKWWKGRRHKDCVLCMATVYRESDEINEDVIKELSKELKKAKEAGK